MNVTIPGLRDGEEAKAIVTFEIRRSLQAAPDETGGFVRPNARRLDSKQAGYLRPSPYIESTDAAIVEAAKTIGADKETAWAQVEAIYDWVREKVTFKDNRGGTVKGAVDTLRDGVGDCDERTSLFIALCRAKGIPARTVRVPGHCYPEFCLLDPNGAGRWFPCQAAGTRAFGAMPDPRPILQKGDNVASLDPRTRGRSSGRRPSRAGTMPAKCSEPARSLPVGPACARTPGLLPAPTATGPPGRRGMRDGKQWMNG
jgi:hypothetical protein